MSGIGSHGGGDKRSGSLFRTPTRSSVPAEGGPSARSAAAAAAQTPTRTPLSTPLRSQPRATPGSTHKRDDVLSKTRQRTRRLYVSLKQSVLAATSASHDAIFETKSQPQHKQAAVASAAIGQPNAAERSQTKATVTDTDTDNTHPPTALRFKFGRFNNHPPTPKRKAENAGSSDSSKFISVDGLANTAILATDPTNQAGAGVRVGANVRHGTSDQNRNQMDQVGAKRLGSSDGAESNSEGGRQSILPSAGALGMDQEQQPDDGSDCPTYLNVDDALISFSRPECYQMYSYSDPRVSHDGNARVADAAPLLPATPISQQLSKSEIAQLHSATIMGSIQPPTLHDWILDGHPAEWEQQARRTEELLQELDGTSPTHNSSWEVLEEQLRLQAGLIGQQEYQFADGFDAPSSTDVSLLTFSTFQGTATDASIGTQVQTSTTAAVAARVPPQFSTGPTIVELPPLPNTQDNDQDGNLTPPKSDGQTARVAEVGIEVNAANDAPGEQPNDDASVDWANFDGMISASGTQEVQVAQQETPLEAPSDDGSSKQAKQQQQQQQQERQHDTMSPVHDQYSHREDESHEAFEEKKEESTPAGVAAIHHDTYHAASFSRSDAIDSPLRKNRIEFTEQETSERTETEIDAEEVGESNAEINESTHRPQSPTKHAAVPSSQHSSRADPSVVDSWHPTADEEQTHDLHSSTGLGTGLGSKSLPKLTSKLHDDNKDGIKIPSTIRVVSKSRKNRKGQHDIDSNSGPGIMLMTARAMPSPERTLTTPSQLRRPMSFSTSMPPVLSSTANFDSPEGRFQLRRQSSATVPVAGMDDMAASNSLSQARRRLDGPDPRTGHAHRPAGFSYTDEIEQIVDVPKRYFNDEDFDDTVATLKSIAWEWIPFWQSPHLLYAPMIANFDAGDAAEADGDRVAGNRGISPQTSPRSGNASVISTADFADLESNIPLVHEQITSRLCNLDESLKTIQIGLLNTIQPHVDTLHHANITTHDLMKCTKLSQVYVERSKESIRLARGDEADGSGLLGGLDLLNAWDQQSSYQDLSSILAELREIFDLEIELDRRIERFTVRNVTRSTVLGSAREIINLAMRWRNAVHSSDSSLGRLECLQASRERCGTILASTFFTRICILLESNIVRACDVASTTGADRSAFNGYEYETLMQVFKLLCECEGCNSPDDVSIMVRHWATSIQTALLVEVDRAFAFALLDPSTLTADASDESKAGNEDVQGRARDDSYRERCDAASDGKLGGNDGGGSMGSSSSTDLPDNALPDFEKELGILNTELQQHWGNSAAMQTILYNLITIRFDLEGTTKHHIAGVWHRLLFLLTNIIRAHCMILAWHQQSVMSDCDDGDGDTVNDGANNSGDGAHRHMDDQEESKLAAVVAVTVDAATPLSSSEIGASQVTFKGISAQCLKQIGSHRMSVWNHTLKVMDTCLEEHLRFAPRKILFDKREAENGQRVVIDDVWQNDLVALEDIEQLTRLYILLQDDYLHFGCKPEDSESSSSSTQDMPLSGPAAIQESIWAKVSTLQKQHIRSVHVEAMNTVGVMLWKETWALSPLPVANNDDGFAAGAASWDSRKPLGSRSTATFPTDQAFVNRLQRPVEGMSFHKHGARRNDPLGMPMVATVAAATAAAEEAVRTTMKSNVVMKTNPFLLEITSNDSRIGNDADEKDAKVATAMPGQTEQPAGNGATAPSLADFIGDSSSFDGRVSLLKLYCDVENLESAPLIPDSIRNGLLSWSWRLLQVLHRIPSVADDAVRALSNINDLYLTTVFRLCSGSAKNERILLGIDDPGRATALSTASVPPRPPKRPSSPLLSFRRRSVSKSKHGAASGGVGDANGQSRNSSKAASSGGGAPTTISAQIDAEICSPFKNEKMDRERLRDFILDAQRRLVDVVKLDLVDQWVPDIDPKSSSSTDMVLEYASEVARVLEKRIAAAWSCVFVVKIISLTSAMSSNGRAYFVIDRRGGNGDSDGDGNGDGTSADAERSNTDDANGETDTASIARDLKKLETYADEVARVAPELLAVANRMSAVRALNAKSILQEIITMSPTWGQQVLHEHANDYVDNLCEFCACIWYTLSSGNRLGAKAIDYSWESLLDAAHLILLEGFSRLRYCSTEGRSLMSMDVACLRSGTSANAVAARLEENYGIPCLRMPPELPSGTPAATEPDQHPGSAMPSSSFASHGSSHGAAYVDTYIKVHYLPREDVMQWIEDNHRQYKLGHSVALAVSSFQGERDGKELNKCIDKIVAFHDGH